MDQPLISVVIPTYNRGATLPKAIQSVINQTYTNWELLICDDGSTDNTKQIVQQISDQRIHWIPGLHKGQPATPRNRGIRHARGSLIAFLDSDDEWLPKKIETQLSTIQKLNAKVCCTNAFTDVSSKKKMFSLNKRWLPYWTLARSNYVITSSIIFSRELLKKIDEFPEDAGLIAIEDYALWLRIAACTQIAYISEPLLVYTGDSQDSVRKILNTDFITQRKRIGKNFDAWAISHRIFMSYGLIFNFFNLFYSIRYSKKNSVQKIKDRIKSILPFGMFRVIADMKNQWRNFFKSEYSQAGEDLIVDDIFKKLGKEKITYIDIGAHHPTYINNTYLFYKKGGTGICIEPDPDLFEKIKRKRDRDTCLNIGIGIGAQPEIGTFYILSTPTLNTFSKEDAETSVRQGHSIIRTINVPLRPINDIMKNSLNDAPDFISLDTEGFDYKILKSFDFSTYRPNVFCIETVDYSKNEKGVRRQYIIDFMAEKGYVVYRNTAINTIFVDKAII